MSWKKFLLADGTSAFITITLWGGLGYVGANHIGKLRTDMVSLEFISTVFLAILVGSVLFFRYLKKRRISISLGEVRR